MGLVITEVGLLSSGLVILTSWSQPQVAARNNLAFPLLEIVVRPLNRDLPASEEFHQRIAHQAGLDLRI